MHSRRSILPDMDATEAAHAFTELYPAVYRHTYRRRDPRAFHPGREALAMLEHLADTGPLTVTEAARHLDRSQSATSERIERLIERGLLARIPDERDRRRHLVWLTEAGLALHREEREVLSRELVQGALERMKPADRNQLIHTMRSLVAACREHAQQRRRADESEPES